MTAAPLPDGTLAGYRLVRRLGSGSRADVYLGVSPQSVGSQSVGSRASVALKVFVADTTHESIGAELDALGRLDSPHLVSLLDLSSAQDGRPIFVLERVSRGSVSALLASREWLECGEAVTLLAPIATLIGQLHDVGVAHGRITGTAVHLGAEGQPVLLGLGHCDLFEPNGTMAAIDSLAPAARDRDALASLALGVLSRVRPGDCHVGVGDLTEWIASAPRAYEFPNELAERLFTCAEPLPISVGEDREIVPTVPGRVVPFSLDRLPSPATEREWVAQPVEGPDDPLPRWLPPWVAELLIDNPVSVLKKRAITLVRGVRPRFWVIAGVAVIGLILAIALVPSAVAPEARSVVTTAPPAVAPTIPVSTPLPDDPLRASGILLKARATCFRDRSILCLDGVDEASSAAFTTDAGEIQQIQSGGEIPRSAVAQDGTLALTERLGDTALVSVSGQSGPASILVIRTKAGWRIRDYLSGEQATPASTG